MKIAEIMFIEVRLVSLFSEAKRLRNLPDKIKWKYWYKILKPKMSKLVGFDADNKKLTSSEVYDKVYFSCMDLMEL